MTVFPPGKADPEASYVIRVPYTVRAALPDFPDRGRCRISGVGVRGYSAGSGRGDLPRPVPGPARDRRPWSRRRHACRTKPAATPAARAVSGHWRRVGGPGLSGRQPGSGRDARVCGHAQPGNRRGAGSRRAIGRNSGDGEVGGTFGASDAHRKRRQGSARRHRRGSQSLTRTALRFPDTRAPGWKSPSTQRTNVSACRR